MVAVEQAQVVMAARVEEQAGEALMAEQQQQVKAMQVDFLVVVLMAVEVAEVLVPQVVMVL